MLKKTSVISGFLSVLLLPCLFSSCLKMDVELQKCSEYIITARIDNAAGKASSQEDGNNLQPALEISDEVAVFDGMGNTYGFKIFKIESDIAYLKLITEGDGCGNTTVAPQPGDVLYAIFAPGYNCSDIVDNSMRVSIASQNSGNGLPWVMTAKSEVTSTGDLSLVFINHLAVIGLREPTFPGMRSGNLSSLSASGEKVYREAMVRVDENGSISVVPDVTGPVHLSIADPVAVTNNTTPDGTILFLGMFDTGGSADLNITAGFNGYNGIYRMQKKDRRIFGNHYYYTSGDFKNLKGALAGRFSISPNREIYFSQGNLLCDSSKDSLVWDFEDKQYFVPYLNEMDGIKTSYDAAHIRHFFWSTEAVSVNDNGYGSGMSYYMFAGEKDTDVTDWGKAYDRNAEGWFTLSADEWNYLLRSRGSGTLCVRKDVSIAGIADNFLVIAPDGNTINIKGQYNLIDWFEAERNGFVCLAPTGYRDAADNVLTPCLIGIGNNGLYWSRTACKSIDSFVRAGYICFGESPLIFSAKASGDRMKGMAVRLVIE